MLVLEDDYLSFVVSESASIHYLSDYMKSNFDIFTRIVKLIMKITEKVDFDLYSFFQSCNLEPFFATSWIIAWFSHDVKSLATIARIFDVILASHPFFIIYLSVAVSKRTSLICLNYYAILHLTLI